jgi:hypothetical protein
MKKLFKLTLLLFCTFCLHSCDTTLDELVKSPLTNEEVIAGLRQALSVGTDTSVTKLNKVNGFFADASVKILLPQEAREALSLMQSVSPAVYDATIAPLVDDVVLSMNRAAEDAAIKAKPIFVNAITGITIEDGFSILKGSDTAATSYLRSRTYNDLYSAFQPDINTSLDKKLILNKSTNELWNNFVSAYNSAVPLASLLDSRVKTIHPNLSAHVTSRCLNGVFRKVAEEEEKIRQNPLHRVTELLKRVFGNENK